MQIVTLDKALKLLEPIRKEREKLVGSSLPSIPSDDQIRECSLNTPPCFTIKDDHGGPDEVWVELVLLERSGKTGQGGAIAFFTQGLCIYLPDLRTVESKLPSVFRWSKSEGTEPQPLHGARAAQIKGGLLHGEPTLLPNLPSWLKFAYGRPIYFTKSKELLPRLTTWNGSILKQRPNTNQFGNFQSGGWKRILEIYRTVRNATIEEVWPLFHALPQDQKAWCKNTFSLESEQAADDLCRLLIKHLETVEKLEPTASLGSVADTLNIWKLRQPETDANPSNIWASLLDSITKYNPNTKGPWTDAAKRIEMASATPTAYFHAVALSATDLTKIFEKPPTTLLRPSQNSIIVDGQFLATLPISFFTETTWRELLGTVRTRSQSDSEMTLPWAIPANLEEALCQLNRPEVLDAPALLQEWVAGI